NGIIVPVWFEDVILDASTRKKLLEIAGLDPRSRNGNNFNPVASRRNIGLYQRRPDLAPLLSEEDADLLYAPRSWSRRWTTSILDHLLHGFSARANRAGAYSKTGRLGDIAHRHDR